MATIEERPDSKRHVINRACKDLEECGRFSRAQIEHIAAGLSEVYDRGVDAVAPTTATARPEHRLKTWPEYFAAVASGEKTFEFRKDDRAFVVGDLIVLEEYQSGKGYTGHQLRRGITYIMRGGTFGLPVGLVVLGISDTDPTRYKR